MEKLKPCPFCGGEARIVVKKTNQVQTSLVKCLKCRCIKTKVRPAYYDGDIQADAVAEWNRGIDEE